MITEKDQWVAAYWELISLEQPIDLPVKTKDENKDERTEDHGEIGPNEADGWDE